MASPRAPDGGFWAWLAVFGCFMGNVLGDGVMYSFGVFVPKLKEYFNAGSAEISFIYSLQVGVTFGSGPVASFMTNRLGWIWSTIIGTLMSALGLVISAYAPNIYLLYIGSGIILGLGLGIIYLPRLDCITQYFDKKRPFVTGLAICGSGLGTFIFAPITERLIRDLGWQNAMLTIAGICMLNCIFAFCFKPLKNDEADQDPEVRENLNGGEDLSKSEKKETLSVMLTLLRDVIFMMFAVSNFFTSLGYPIPYTFIPDNAKILGMRDDEGSFVISIIGISNTIARLILGVISQKVDRLFLYNTCLVFCGFSMSISNYIQPTFEAVSGYDCSLYNSTMNVSSTTVLPDVVSTMDYGLETNDYDYATTMMPSNISMDDLMDTFAENTNNLLSPVPEPIPWQCSAYVGQMIYALIYGVTSAAYVLLTTLVLADLLGPALFTNSFGLLLLFQGVATIIGPPIVGYMFDVYGNYDYGFIIMGIMITISGLMLYPIPLVQKMLKDKKKPLEDVS